MEDREKVTTATQDVEEPVENKNASNEKEVKEESKHPLSVEDVLEALNKATPDMLLKVPTVKELVENARRQEKDKLYKTLEKIEKEKNEYKTKLEETESKLKEYETQNLSFEEKMQLKLKELEETYSKQLLDLQNELRRMEEEARKKELQAYKERRLREVGHEIIPELVQGNTVEEIEESIKYAQQRYRELVSEFEQRFKEAQSNQVKNVAKTVNPSINSIPPLSVEDIRNMSLSDYAKRRDQLLEALRRGELK